MLRLQKKKETPPSRQTYPRSHDTAPEFFYPEQTGIPTRSSAAQSTYSGAAAMGKNPFLTESEKRVLSRVATSEEEKRKEKNEEEERNVCICVFFFLPITSTSSSQVVPSSPSTRTKNPPLPLWDKFYLTNHHLPSPFPPAADL